MPKRRSDELSAIDEVMPLVDRFNELEHAQKLIFLDMVDPLPEEVAPIKKSQKKASKKSSTSKSATKSERASGMAAQLKERRKQGPETLILCAHVFEGGDNCGEAESSGIHDPTMGYRNYHFFEPSTTAPPAPAPSPANGGVESTAQNLGVGAASAQAATGGSNE